ncbi:MAG: hypothetical protein Q4C65_14190 [Eubacteriales bacterium]|nr:hypothetical protein [Eubacteriales bacterium]
MVLNKKTGAFAAENGVSFSGFERLSDFLAKNRIARNDRGLYQLPLMCNKHPYYVSCIFNN